MDEIVVKEHSKVDYFSLDMNERDGCEERDPVKDEEAKGETFRTSSGEALLLQPCFLCFYCHVRK